MGSVFLTHNGTVSRLVFKIILCVALLAGLASSGYASQRDLLERYGQPKPTPKPRPFIKNLPTKGPVDIVVLGDSLADGLYIGLKRLNRKNRDLKIIKASKVNTGLVRSDRYDWNKAARKIARTGKYQVAVVLLGLNDLQTFRHKVKKRLHFKRKGWVKQYKERIEKMIIDLKKADMAVYWVGIPITSPKRYQKEYAFLNDFFISAAQKHELRYVDTWSVIAGEDGKYSPFWRYKSGKRKKIRLRDGVHFTIPGYVILAEPVNRIIQRDIQAVRERRAER